MKNGVWLKLGTQPGCELIAKMADAGCYYNGAGLVQAENALVADEIIGMLRKMDIEVERAQRPERSRLMGWTGYAVSSAIDWPKRIFG
tara:strand:+ start:2026 stop:2289 length:264 start_codon:yes stop_codon:yes gene_type:complete